MPRHARAPPTKRTWLVAAAFVALPPAASVAASAEWAAFKRRFGRTYASAAEEARRRAVFGANLARVAAARNPALGVTKFSDLTRAEFAARYLRAPSPDEAASEAAARAARARWGGGCTACGRFPEMANYSAGSLDWSRKGAVTGVKDQGECDSCYAFGATGDMESAWFMAGNPLASLSEQELVSCVGGGTKKGCGGGSRAKMFKWVIDNGGIVSEATYPYTSGYTVKAGACLTRKERPVAATFSSYEQVSDSADGEARIMAALQKAGPVSVGVSATHLEFYVEGVDAPDWCSPKHDHAVIVVGYGTDPTYGTYWKIKNSWGRDWGEDGYFRAARGINWCGMNTDAVHARVGGGKRYHCHAATQTCAEADKGHATLRGCEAACGGGPAPPSPPPRPTPAPAPRYHCDNATFRCAEGAEGHSSLQKCQAACLAPGYACDPVTRTCHGVPTRGDKKHVCEDKCGASPSPPAPAPPPPSPRPTPRPPPAPPGPPPCGVVQDCDDMCRCTGRGQRCLQCSYGVVCDRCDGD